MTLVYGAWSALDPLFVVVMEGLRGHVDGDHYFDTLTDDLLFEFRYRFPGYPGTVRGRRALMDLYAGYSMKLKSADGLVIRHDYDTDALILEYEVHGTAPSGHVYDNRFVSIAYIKDRKIVRCRDYMDSLAAFTAIRGD